MATASLLGRNTAGAGVPEVLSKATALSLLNVEDGADVTAAANVATAGAVMKSTVDAKGDIFVATADNTVIRLAVGATDDHVLTVDSGEASGVKWAAAGGGGGIVVQQVRTSTNTYSNNAAVPLIPVDNSIPQQTEGLEVLTLAITPTNSSNILLIEGEVQAAFPAVTWTTIAVFQDATADAIGSNAQYISGSYILMNRRIFHYMVAGTTSATTIKIRIGQQATTSIYINGNHVSRLFGGTSSCYLKITEITV